jgi:hypothetical protein
LLLQSDRKKKQTNQNKPAQRNAARRLRTYFFPFHVSVPVAVPVHTLRTCVARCIGTVSTLLQRESLELECAKAANTPRSLSRFLSHLTHLIRALCGNGFRLTPNAKAGNWERRETIGAKSRESHTLRQGGRRTWQKREPETHRLCFRPPSKRLGANDFKPRPQNLRNPGLEEGVVSE